MIVLASLIRAINLAGRNRIMMQELREIHEQLSLADVQTYLQSGNVVFRSVNPKLEELAAQIESAIHDRLGFRPAVILRTAADLRRVVDRNPFADEPGVSPNRLLVYFLARDVRGQLLADASRSFRGPEVIRPGKRELYIYFPDGLGRSKLSLAALERLLGTVGTGRNWNTVVKLLQAAERLEQTPSVAMSKPARKNR
jgi:uncharacterized protein (DUF1697 family)